MNKLRGAKVEENSDSDGSTYRVVILTSNGNVPFTSYSSSGKSDKQAIASQIEEFVKNQETISLKQEQDDRWLILFGGIFVVVGCAMLLVAVVTCVFDKTLDTLTLRRQGLLGTKVFERRQA